MTVAMPRLTLSTRGTVNVEMFVGLRVISLSIHRMRIVPTLLIQAPPSRHYPSSSPSHYDRYDPHYRRHSHTSRDGFTRTAPHVRHSDSDDNNYYGQGRF